MCTKDNKNNKLLVKFKEINNLIDNIDSFEKYTFNNDIDNNKTDQLFSKDKIPFEVVNKIIIALINKNLTDDIYFEFTIKNLIKKIFVEKMNEFIPELKQYYLKCKHDKYLENLNEKKVITILRQILRVYDFSINSIEKYNNGEKFLLYILQKNKSIGIKKISSLINFD
jgi:hypothetical protein